jgi:hypothetical protein
MDERQRARFAGMVEDVDFPRFVAELMEGVFAAIVDASVQQMDAYSELLDEVAAALGEFVRDHLPHAGDGCRAGRSAASRSSAGGGASAG